MLTELDGNDPGVAPKEIGGATVVRRTYRHLMGEQITANGVQGKSYRGCVFRLPPTLSLPMLTLIDWLPQYRIDHETVVLSHPSAANRAASPCCLFIGPT